MAGRLKWANTSQNISKSIETLNPETKVSIVDKRGAYKNITKLLQILKEKKVDLLWIIDQLRYESNAKMEWYLEGYNIRILQYKGQLTLEEMALIVEWLKADRGE